MNLLYRYLIAGSSWSIFAATQQYKLYGINWRMPVCIILNCLLWPAAMIIAIKNSLKEIK